MDRRKAQEVIDGAMLSDANLSRPRGLRANSQFHIEQSDHSHIDWLLTIKEALLIIGVGVSPIYPKIRYRQSHGKDVSAVTLPSLLSPILTTLYRKWYPNGVKCVPSDIIITPVTLAHWFMGDGSSSIKHGTSLPLNSSVRINLATCSFTFSEVDSLVVKLHILGIAGAYTESDNGYPTIHINKADDVVLFMNIVRPYICASFTYKIKIPAPVR